jgi:hypothetical protein
LLRGLLPVRPTSYVDPHKNAGKAYVWRNTVTEGYKIATQFEHLPVDLSNYLAIRTRER